MEWGPDRGVVKPAFYDEWSGTICMHDRMFWTNQRLNAGESDVYQYLQLKLRQVLNQVRRVGQAGWSFRQSDMKSITNCLVWADGTHCQETPLTLPSSNERWWPCIVLMDDSAHLDLKPFYCPALAWQNARPWYVHVSRICYISSAC